MTREKKYLKETKNFSEGVIYDKMRDYLEEQKPKLFKELVRKKEVGSFIDPIAKEALMQINELMENGYSEMEAWEIAREIVYI